jgi:ectoine hydroxylase-related dioxygenase (phytanoyl-CoA dioxygenase family)
MNELATAGFHVVPDLLTKDDVEHVRAAITETINRTAQALRTPFATSCPDASFEERLDRVAMRDRAYAFALFHAVMADAQRDSRIASLANHRGLASTAAAILAPATVTGAVVRTRAVIPSLSTNHGPWHQDVLTPTHDGRSCGSVRIACWIPLTDVDAQSGALEVMPGAWTPLPHTDEDGRFSIPAEHLPVGPRSPVPLLAGDGLMLDRFVPHRSLPATAPRARWAVVLWIKASAYANCC